MNANQTRLEEFLGGAKQYMVPIYQRPYTWSEQYWKRLWEDLTDLYQREDPRPHFFGSIVTLPTTSVPEGVPKYLLIDGQQRLTTIAILLSAVRNLARERGLQLADEIHELYLVNKFKSGLDHHRVLPTRSDREEYSALVSEIGTAPVGNGNISKAYRYFDKCLRRGAPDLSKVTNAAVKRLTIVSVVLDAADNPNLVFEGLNAKGQPLTQADLIRNFFVMQVHVDTQEEIYRQLWEPIEKRFDDGNVLNEFMRHYLMKYGKEVKKSDVYLSLKDEITSTNAIAKLKDLSTFASYYERLLDPTKEPNARLSNQLRRLKQLDINFSYPFLLNLYDEYNKTKIDEVAFIDALKCIENFFIRRFVAGTPTFGLHKVFAGLHQQINVATLVDTLSRNLAAREYPTDQEIRERLKVFALYGAGDRLRKTQLILNSIEDSFAHKEKVSNDALTVEHVMPQTLSQQWREALPEECIQRHPILLHTLGNLTLTAYNSELSNSTYEEKKTRLDASHLEINRYFASTPVWDCAAIERRSAELAEIFLKLWPHLAKDTERNQPALAVRGTKPESMTILGEQRKLESWRDCLIQVMSVIADLKPESFGDLQRSFPTYLSRDASTLRTPGDIQNGYFVEIDLKPETIKKLCDQALDEAGISPHEWHVDYS